MCTCNFVESDLVDLNLTMSSSICKPVSRLLVKRILLVFFQGKVVVHSISPYAMCWTSNHIVVGGSDKKIVFYSHEGSVAQQFDYFRDPTEKEFTVMCCSPSGQAVAVGSYDRIRVYR